jgi:hypothetical protein
MDLLQILFLLPMIAWTVVYLHTRRISYMITFLLSYSYGGGGGDGAMKPHEDKVCALESVDVNVRM